MNTTSMRKRPRYGVTQTLLDCSGGPDVNRRTLVDSWNGYCEVAVFNQHMQPWTKADDHRLKLTVEALNMLPSCEAMAQNVKAHCQGMAEEIARRVVDELGAYSRGRDVRHVVEACAMAVLLDWFLGDWLPDRAKLPPASDSNSPSQEG